MAADLGKGDATGQDGSLKLSFQLGETFLTELFKPLPHKMGRTKIQVSRERSGAFSPRALAPLGTPGPPGSPLLGVGTYWKFDCPPGFKFKGRSFAHITFWYSTHRRMASQTTSRKRFTDRSHYFSSLAPPNLRPCANHVWILDLATP